MSVGTGRVCFQKYRTAAHEPNHGLAETEDAERRVKIQNHGPMRERRRSRIHVQCVPTNSLATPCSETALPDSKYFFTELYTKRTSFVKIMTQNLFWSRYIPNNLADHVLCWSFSFAREQRHWALHRHSHCLTKPL